MSVNKKLMQDLDRACLRYLEVRIRFYLAKINMQDISEIDAERTLAHNALISCFNPVLRQTADKQMAVASVNRIAIGNWGLRRAVALLDGTESLGNL